MSMTVVLQNTRTDEGGTAIYRSSTFRPRRGFRSYLRPPSFSKGPAYTRLSLLEEPDFLHVWRQKVSCPVLLSQDELAIAAVAVKSHLVIFWIGSSVWCRALRRPSSQDNIAEIFIWPDLPFYSQDTPVYSLRGSLCSSPHSGSPGL